MRKFAQQRDEYYLQRINELQELISTQFLDLTKAIKNHFKPN